MGHQSLNPADFPENWYALYVSIVKGVGINGALELMGAKEPYKSAERRKLPEKIPISAIEGESYYFLNVVCGIQQKDLSLLINIPVGLISKRVCHCRNSYKKSKEEEKNERN